MPLGNTWDQGKLEITLQALGRLLFRPWLMEQALAKVSAGHQKAAWDVAGLDLGTQVKKARPDGDL